jgi:hypothetical protein
MDRAGIKLEIKLLLGRGEKEKKKIKHGNQCMYLDKH